jgi:hypothetical protein
MVTLALSFSTSFVFNASEFNQIALFITTETSLESSWWYLKPIDGSNTFVVAHVLCPYLSVVLLFVLTGIGTNLELFPTMTIFFYFTNLSVMP